MILKNRIVILLLSAFLLAFVGLSTRARASASPNVPDGPVVVRVYYGTRENLDTLAKTLDIWEVDHTQAYLVALVSPDQYIQLDQAGYRMEIDEVRTAALNQPHEYLPGQNVDTIPGYSCYRTVGETYSDLQALALNHPNLAQWIDIGDSWEKTQGMGGYDIYALKLTNQLRTGNKPTFFLMAEIHAREYVTAETATRFAEYLVANYGTDPDITWLLNYYQVYIVAMTNPDGRIIAEQGVYWRKNTDNDDGCTDENNWGTDLNRNSTFKWNVGGSSGDPCDETYHGPVAGSEPEVQAIQNFVLTLFPDQRGSGDTDPAPADTTGVFITLHSAAGLDLWPWGWSSKHAPNSTQLQTLGRKLAYFNNYTPEQSYQLYQTSGTTDDWAYGELGVAAYTFEMGTDFFQDCSSFESTVYPNNRDALMYAFKAARLPYMNPAGPESLSVTATPSTVQPGTSVLLEAVANDTRYRSGEPTQNIAAAQYTIDDPSWITGTATAAMTADDGSFDEKTENVGATVDTTCLAPGSHELFVESKDANNNWGVPGSVFLTVGEAHAVSLSPAVAVQDGVRGHLMAYPFTVENLGNASDTFTVTLESNWDTTALTEIANLAGCSQAVLTVTVAVPGDAEIGMSDVATVKVISHADPAQSASAQLTTQVTGSAPEVVPLTAAQAGDPGQQVVYGLLVTNTNEISDTFDLVLHSAWAVDAPLTLGPLDPFGHTGLVVTVTVPETATAGAMDVASLGFVSHHPGVLPITATLTTSANTVYAFAATAPILQQGGLPESVVTFSVYITNTGNITDTFDLTISHVWDVAYSPAIGPLAPGQSAVIVISVSVPPDGILGTSDTAEVAITSRGDNALVQSFNLITNLYHREYLAIINK